MTMCAGRTLRAELPDRGAARGGLLALAALAHRRRNTQQ